MVLLVAVTSLPFAAWTSGHAAAQPGALAANTAKLLDYANRERQARGIAPLARDSRLDVLAQGWAEHLAATGGYAHNDAAMAQVRRMGFRGGAENMHQRFEPIDANYVHNGWMGSDHHRKNMLEGGYELVGFGIACSNASGRPYYVAVADYAGDGNRRSNGATPPPWPHVAGADQVQPIDCVSDAAQGFSALPLPPPPGLSPALPLSAPTVSRVSKASKAATAFVDPNPAPPPPADPAMAWDRGAVQAAAAWAFAWTSAQDRPRPQDLAPTAAAAGGGSALVVGGMSLVGLWRRRALR